VTQVRIEVPDSGPVLVELAGDFDLSTCGEMARCFDSFAPGDVVVLDMAEVTFVDSIAIGVLAKAAGRGVRLRPRAMSTVVSRALELSGLLAIFDAGDP
jgi:anti-anti-sigma factor